MKVSIDFSDGQFTMREDKFGQIEVTAQDWQEYREHLKQCNRWHSFLRKLDNEYFDKRMKL